MIPEDLKKPLQISLGIHAFVAVLLVVRPYFATKIDPYEKAVRVDIIAMPEKAQKKQALPPKPKASPKKPEPKKTKPKKPVAKSKKPEKVKPIETPVKKSSISEADALKKLLAKTKKTEEEPVKPSEEVQKLIKGNIVSKGSDLVGIQKIEYSNYRSVLHAAISAKWDLPKWLLEGDLVAQAHIKIDNKGNVIFKKLTKESGNGIYDQKVLEAIDAATPFKAPPEKFRNIVRYEGVLLSFP